MGLVGRTVGIACALSAAFVLHSSQALAHEGHDHGPSVEIVMTAAPRFEAVSDDLELLGLLKNGSLVVYLDRFKTNEPIRNASIEATLNGEPVRLEPSTDGTFSLKHPLLANRGRIELIFTVKVGELSDLLAGSLEIAAPVQSVTPAPTLLQQFDANRAVLLAAAAGALVGALVVLALRRNSPRTASPSGRPFAPKAVSAEADDETPERTRPARMTALTRSWLLLSVSLMALQYTAEPAQSQQPAAKQRVAITADIPQRLPDGTVFMPKETQRLLGVRTVLAGESNAAQTLQLSGQITFDPNGFGRVQAPVDGRIEMPPQGLLPLVGQRVEKGQVLAYLMPIVPTADRSSYESTLGEIETRIALAEQKLARISRIPGAVPQKDIDDTRAELDSLLRRRTAVRGTVRERHELVAPISGVISNSIAVPGQLANAREVIFEIVDPTKLWVEAIAYDAHVANDIEAARLKIGNDEQLSLRFVSRGRALRQQGTPLHFSIDNPPETLSIGKSVMVIIQTRTKRSGIVLPQAAIVRTANGLHAVWTHTGAERFRPNVVKIQALDGDRVVIESGLAPNARVVSEGAAILSQVR